MNTRILSAWCASCDKTYTTEDAIEHVKKIRASISNREIWAQNHCDVTGHTRIHFTDTTSITRILGRSDQMTLAEDPDIDLKDLA